MSRDEYNERVREARKAIVEYLKENEEAKALEMYRELSPEPKIDRKYLAAAMCDLTISGEVTVDGDFVARLS